LVSPLEKVTHTIVMAIEVLRIRAVQIAHPLRERRTRCMHEQVIVIVHETVGEHLPVQTDADVGERLQESRPVVLVQEYILKGVAAGDHVVQGIHELKPERAGHRRRQSANSAPPTEPEPRVWPPRPIDDSSMSEG